MKNLLRKSLCLALFASMSPIALAGASYLIDQDKLAAKTPEQALSRLTQGNQRFVTGQMKQMDLLKMVKKSQAGQYPSAIVLSCIDSRVPVEIVFDQGVGNVFVARTAGNVLSDDTVAGLEYATNVVGSKLIVVMGHEGCGAVGAACKGVKMGHITALLDKIQPAVSDAHRVDENGRCDDDVFVNEITSINAKNIAKEITSISPIIKKLVDDKKVKIVSAMYHTDTGKVDFYDN